MTLSEIQRLPIKDKCNWLLSKAGLAQLKLWLIEGLPLRVVAKHLEVPYQRIYIWRAKYAVIADVVKAYSPVKVPKVTPIDLTRKPAYRLIAGLDSYNRRGEILREHPTAEALWQDPFFDRYFTSNGVNKQDYYAEYLRQLISESCIQLSNLYTVAYCEIDVRGSVKILKPSL